MNNSSVPYTQVPNVIIEKFLADISDSEFCLLMIIVRKTIGFHKSKDKIAVSTFEKFTGKSRDTVINALKKLEKSGLVVRDRETIPHSYSLSETITQERMVEKKDVQNSNLSPVVKPDMVEFSNQNMVVPSNPQKNTLKQNEINTTTNSISEEGYLKICNFWNELFGNTLDPENQKIKKQIFQAMAQFSVNQLKKAMFYRSKSDFYRKKVPYLRSSPESFFGYPETIANDLQRKPENLFTYTEMVNKVTSENLNMGRNFQKIEHLQENEERLWEFKSQKNEG